MVKMSNYKKLEDLGETNDIFDNIVAELPEDTSEEVIHIIQVMAEKI